MRRPHLQPGHRFRDEGRSPDSAIAEILHLLLHAPIMIPYPATRFTTSTRRGPRKATIAAPSRNPAANAAHNLRWPPNEIYRHPSGVISRAPHGRAATRPPPPPPADVSPRPPPPKAYRTRAAGSTVRSPTTTGSPYTFLTDAPAETRSAMFCSICPMSMLSVEHNGLCRRIDYASRRRPILPACLS